MTNRICKMLFGGWLFGFIIFVAPGVMAAEISVAVASNFLAPLQRLVTTYESQHDHRIKISSASTGKLYAQIVNGAPYDIFLAANQREPERLERDGQIIEGSRITYARGRLAVISSTPNKYLEPKSIQEVRRIAIADPKLAPYGEAAQAILNTLTLDTKTTIVKAENIAQAYLYVKTKNVDVGFVAYSQLKGPNGVSNTFGVWLPDNSDYPAIKQQGVILSRAKNNAAVKSFWAFLQHPTTQQRIRDMGYAERL